MVVEDGESVELRVEDHGFPASVADGFRAPPCRAGAWIGALPAQAGHLLLSHGIQLFLPDIDQGKVPAEGAAALGEALDKVINAVFRAGPAEVIDRCRDAAQVALGVDRVANLGDQKARRAEFGDLIKKMESEVQGAAPPARLSAARIIQRMHQRAKPNEQERLGSRPVVDADAEAAVSMLGLMLRELGWTSP